MKPKFSIITPCFNSEKTIERTINSVLNQTYSDFEYIIIDGGSTDNTLFIVEKYKSSFGEKLKIVSEPDKGIYDAMNKGIRLATGELIGIVNSDDFYEKNALEIISKKYNNNQYQIIYGAMKIINRNEEELAVVFYNHNNLEQQMINHPTVFVSKKVYDELGSYDLKYKSASDYDFLLKMKKNTKVNFIPVHDVISNFSRGGMSSTSTSVLETYDILFKYGIISKKSYKLNKIKVKLKKRLGI